MADYWKSQPRKYCEICQCWFADNKISVEHHERGIRHKANVAKHLREARKKNTEDRKEQESVARELIRIELEAQRAYDKDVLEQQLSSSITDPEVKKSLAKVQQKAFRNFSDSATVSSKPQVATESGKHGKCKNSDKESLAAKAKAAFQESYNRHQMKPLADNKLLWWQLTTPEGVPYYYNTVSGVTQWEKPDTLQQANTSEQSTTSGEDGQTATAYHQASASSEGNASTAGVKRPSSNDDTNSDSGSEVKRPYDGRGYCRGGAYGSWTVVAERLLQTSNIIFIKQLNREQYEEEKEEENDTVEQDFNVKAESSSSSSDSEDEGTKELKEEHDERMFKERTVDSMRNETIKQEPVQPGTFSGFSFKKRTNFKKPQIRQRINENDY